MNNRLFFSWILSLFFAVHPVLQPLKPQMSPSHQPFSPLQTGIGGWGC